MTPRIISALEQAPAPPSPPAPPIEALTPVLVAAWPTAAPLSLDGRRLLVLADQAEPCTAMVAELGRAGASVRVVCPADCPLPNATSVDLATCDPAAVAAALAGIQFDTVLALRRASRGEVPSLLVAPIAEETRLLELLFVVCKHAYVALGRGEAAVYGLCLDAFAGGRAEPATGLLGGFLKSLARELPSTTIRNVCCAGTDAREAVQQLAIELGQPREPVEVCWRGGRRETFALAPLPALAAAGSAPLLSAESVVLATGGTGGDTAVLAEELVYRFGCTVIVAGDADPADVPAAPPAMGEPELAALPGRLEHYHLDLLDGEAVARFVDAIYARYGRLDLVVHRAGIEASRALLETSLADFRRVVATKLGTLGALYGAARTRAGAAPVHFHLVTSALGYLGGEGQPDCAADEAMNRLAASMDGRGGASWSSMAGERREIFGRLFAGHPAASVNVLLAARERAFYRPLLAPPTALPLRPPPTSLVKRLAIDLEAAPYLRDHLVQGVPTLPGAFLVGVAADAARELRPRLRIVAFEQISFRRLVRVHEGRATELRLDARIFEEDADESLLRVQVLAEDVVQTEVFMRMVPASRTGESPPGDAARTAVTELRGGLELPDPYQLAGSPVLLDGRFKGLGGLRVLAGRRLAHYFAPTPIRLDDSSDPSSPLLHMLPNVILVDAFWRFGTIMPSTGGLANGGGALAVYVPERWDRMSVFFDYNDFDLGWLHDPVVFTGRNPQPCEDQLLIGRIEAWDREGRLRLTVEGGVCRKLGEVQVPEVEHALSARAERHLVGRSVS